LNGRASPFTFPPPNAAAGDSVPAGTYVFSKELPRMRLIGLTASTCLTLALYACGSTSNDTSTDPPATLPVTEPEPEDTTDPALVAGTAPKDAGKPKPDSGLKEDAGPFIPAPHPSYPQVPKNQGEILKPMKLVTVVASGDPLANDLFAASDAMISGEWWKAVSADYGLGAASKSVHVTGAAITKNLRQSDMESYIAKSIVGTADAQPDGNTMFLLYLPPGITDIDPQTNQVNTNCSLHGGITRSTGAAGMGGASGCGVRTSPGRASSRRSRSRGAMR
jgi:hypothetical protein